MHSTAMFWPMLGMAILTGIATVVVGRRRQAAIRAREMRMDDFVGGGDIPMTPAVWVSTRHLANHFEMPVLFHLICLAHLVLQAGNVLALVLAWAFVLTRALHMREHLGPNRVRRRFNLFLAGTMLMWALWLHLAAVLLLRG